MEQDENSSKHDSLALENTTDSESDNDKVRLR